MNFKWSILSLLLISTSVAGFAQKNLSELSTTEILGTEYYVYEVERGESLYAIAKRYGWEMEEIVRLNPNAVTDLKKGTRLYYPTGRITVVAEEDIPGEPDPSVSYPDIVHNVKKGETIYGISKQYDIPLDEIYALYPETRYGIKPGQILKFEQTPETVGTGYLFYEIKSGETLPYLSQEYNTTVEDILKANPGLSEKNYKEGQVIRLRVGSAAESIKTELVAENKVTGIDSYRVKKNQDWEEISRETGVDEETLRLANSNEETLAEDDVIAVPIVETVEVEKQVIESPVEEERNFSEVYEEVHGFSSFGGRLEEVKVALLLDDPSSKKDIDFTRGFLVALKELGIPDYKVNLNVIDGRVAPAELADKLEDYSPNLIVATADKAFPAFLADYGNTNEVEVVNVFDVRNDLYEDNASMVQLLPSSELFNHIIAAKIANDFSGKSLIMVGNEDETDGVATFLSEKFGDNKQNMTLSEFAEFMPEESESFLIYAYDTKKEAVADILQDLDNIDDNRPTADLTIIGRPNWIVYSDDFGDRFSEHGIYIPSRVWLDSNSSVWTSFCNEYEKMFGSEPVKSYPNFAASGYDTAKFFIPMTAAHGGDFNKIESNKSISTLQAVIDLKRVSNWGGFMNSSAYLLKFLPSGDVEKILVR